jgi:cyclopropane-fatty-acyl-phospholipid synthase
VSARLLGRRTLAARPRPLPAFGRAALGGSVGLGAGYADQRWDVDDLSHLLRRLYRGTRPILSLGSMWANATEARRSRNRTAPTSTHEADRANIARHYDLPPEWFALFLDDSLSYSCALYEGTDRALGEAAARKIERVLEMLELSETAHLLDIGCGWGALALAAAHDRGARVTATTISTQQYDYLRDRARRESLDHRVQVLHDHYDDLTGTYDAIASIEMIEALDWRRHRPFLAACRRLLRPTGLLVLQAITIQDAHFNRVKRHEDFVKRFIFPGGCLPSRHSLERDAEAVGLEILDIRSIGADYSRTLADWRSNLERNWGIATSMGMSSTFLRTWRFYFAYCEAGFRERYLDDYQLILRHR